MPESLRSRARFTPVSLRDHFRGMDGAERNAMPVNRPGHRYIHKPKKILYSSPKALSTTAGAPWYPTFNFRIVAVAFAVAAAPASTCTLDMLLNGVSMFDTGTSVQDTQPQILAGSTNSFKAVPIVQRVSADNSDYLQFQLVTTGSATGPFIVTMYIVEGLGGKI